MATSTHKHTPKTTAKAVKADKPAAPRDPAELAAMIAVDGMPQFKAVSLDKRYVPARLPTGKVIEVWGDAVMRTPEGEVRPLRAGDEVRKGDVILTAQNGIVQMEIEGTRSARLPFGSDMQGPLAQVNATDQFDAPGAGGGDPGSLSDALRVARLSESVTGQDYVFAAAGGGGPGLGEITPNSDTTSGIPGPIVDVQSISVPESGIIVTTGVQPAAVTGLPGFAVFTVHLNSPAVDPVTLGLTLTAGTATLGAADQGGDFGAPGNFQGMEVSTDDGETWVAADTVAVPAGATQALVRVPLHNDTLDEFDETFTLTARSLPGSTQNVLVIANATILDDDDPPTATFTASTIDSSVPESAGQATVTVTLSGPSGKPITIDWATADDTALAGQDYTASSGTLTFAPGETSKTISIPIIDDRRVEPNDRFTVNLSNGVNVNLDPAASAVTVARITILNDDNAPVLVPLNPTAGNEDTPQNGNVLAGATDADPGDTISVVDYTVGGTTVPAGTPTTLPGVGTIVVNPGGTYTFTPAPNYNGPVPPVTFNATDGTNVVPGTIQLTIAPVNDAPVLVHQTPPAQLEDTPQTGNVLTGATDVENDPINVVDFTVGGNTAAAGGTLTVPGVGSFVVNRDGSYVFTPVLNYDGVVPQITFRVTDGTDTVSGDIQLTITPVNDAPVVAAGSASVSEEGLTAGLADPLGTPDTTNATSATGRLAMADPEGTVLSNVHLVAPTEVLTSGGQTISWRGAGTTADPLRGITDGKAVVTASIDANGNYRVDLLAPLDQASRAGEDARTITFGVSASDGQLTSTSTLTVSVEDDAPSFNTTPRNASAGLVNTNLLIVLDTSGSMSTPDGIGGLTRLDSAVQSISTLLDKYELNGNVAVRIVTFADSATPLGGGWLTVQGAKNALATLSALGETNYDDALAQATAAFQTPGAQAGGQNVAYFFSDGNPTAPVGGEGIDAGQEAAWTTFLANQSMRAVAIGLGPDPVAANLDPIAYDGARGVNTGANLVSNFDQLDGVLAGTIVAPLTGFLPGATAQAVGGADGGYISHITIDNFDYSFAASRPLGTITTTAPAGTYTYDATTHVLQVTTARGGSFSVDMDDGSYGYAPPKGAAGPLTETIGFTVGDRDGDSLASTLTINVAGAGAGGGVGGASAIITPASDGPTATAQAISASIPSEPASTNPVPASSGETLHASPLGDVFSWTLADAGQPGAPGTTHVVGFDGQAASRGGDVLNLQDLLQGELAGANGTAGNLGGYLDFSVVGSGNQATTTVQISSQGGLDAGQAVDQVIVLDHLDIRGALGLDGHAANQQIIEAMLQQGKLVVDGSNA